MAKPVRPLVREGVRAGRIVVPVVLLAFAVCHLIRSHLLEWYRVPSHSMEPTLHGDAVAGDLVLVDKTAFWSADPARFDLVVVRHPDEPDGQLVKRLVAWGDDALNVVQLQRGDLFLGSTRQTLERYVKDPLDARSARIPWFAFPSPRGTALDAAFAPSDLWSMQTTGAGEPEIVLGAWADTFRELAATLSRDAQRRRREREPVEPYLPHHLSTAEPVDTRYLGPDGSLSGRGEPYDDIGMELELVLNPECAGVQLVFECRDVYHAFECRTDGYGAYLVGDSVQAALTGLALGPRGTHRLAFGYLDGALFLIVDDEVVWHRATELPPPGPSVFRTPGMPNLLHVGAVGGAVRIRRIDVFHDVYYKPLGTQFGSPPTPAELQPGELFLLGDNTFDSRDSRSGRTFRRADLVGRPIAVIGPATRRRWLNQ